MSIKIILFSLVSVCAYAQETEEESSSMLPYAAGATGAVLERSLTPMFLAGVANNLRSISPAPLARNVGRPIRLGLSIIHVADIVESVASLYTRHERAVHRYNPVGRLNDAFSSGLHDNLKQMLPKSDGISKAYDSGKEYMHRIASVFDVAMYSYLIFSDIRSFFQDSPKSSSGELVTRANVASSQTQTPSSELILKSAADDWLAEAETNFKEAHQNQMTAYSDGLLSVVRPSIQTPAANRLAAEQAMAMRLLNPLEFYDVVIDTKFLLELYRKGLPVRFADSSAMTRFSREIPQETIAVLGHFNAGKSWLLSKLFGLTLPVGTEVHTGGISIKFTQINNGALTRDISVLDTEGLNTPLRTPTEHSDGLIHQLQDQQASEDLLEQVVLTVSDTFLYVVSDLSIEEQKRIIRLQHQVVQAQKANPGSKKRIILVQNLKTLNRSTITRKYVEDLRSFLPGIKLQVADRSSDMYSVQGELGVGNNAVTIEYYFLANDADPKNRNQEVFIALQNAFMSKQTHKENLADNIAKAFSTWSELYMAVPSQLRKDTVRLMQPTTVGAAAEAYPEAFLKMVSPTRSEVSAEVSSQVQMRRRPLIQEVELLGDRLTWALTKEKVSHKVLRGKLVTSNLAVVSFDLPGADMTDFRIKNDGCDFQPGEFGVSISTDDSHNTVIEIKAKMQSLPMPVSERSVPLATAEGQPVSVYHNFAQALNAGYDEAKLLKTRSEKLAGTRPVFEDDGHRTCQMQIKFSPTELSRDYAHAPMISYQDGVLTIGLPLHN